MTEDELSSIRHEIDKIDALIVALLVSRESLVRSAGRTKTSPGEVRAPARATQVVDAAAERAGTLGGSASTVRRIYRTIVDAFIDLETDIVTDDRREAR